MSITMTRPLTTDQLDDNDSIFRVENESSVFMELRDNWFKDSQADITLTITL